MQNQMSLLEEPPVKVSASPDFAKGLLTHAGTSCLSILELLNGIAPRGWYGRTSPAFCQAAEGGILEPSSEGWRSSGMGSPTAFLTLSISDWPSDASVCSLSDILETGDVPRRFFLSAKACRGILRRAEKRGRELPAALESALKDVANNQDDATRRRKIT